ncbi:MAG: hypothetical protein LM522_01495 [Candidatus Contendobacter sp.]|nr:hypothetical protein [Candidatus Contendobacter sp.]
MSRKIVWIPLVSLVEPEIESERGMLLEILVEPGGFGASTEESLQRLRGYGLAVALSDAQAALAVAGLPPPTSSLGREPPVWQVTNPNPRLSNAAGAALGIALGWLLYEGRCPGQQIIASGHFLPVPPSRGAMLAPDPRLAGKLRSALIFGLQAAPLPFLVPAQTIHGTETAQDCAELIALLAALNIRVLPVASLEEAVAVCWRLAQETGVAHPST